METLRIQAHLVARGRDLPTDTFAARATMHPAAEIAEATLRQHDHPALRMRELVQLVAQRVDRTLDVPRLRSILEAYPDRFRLLDPGTGRWRPDEPAGVDSAASAIDVWVVGVVHESPPPAAPMASKLRESVRWMARGVDPRSSSEVGRWYALALAEREVRRSVVRRAA